MRIPWNQCSDPWWHNVRIGIVGGTGEIGEGMALRFSKKFEVLVGSRDQEKAEETCTFCRNIMTEKGESFSLCGVTNQEAVDGADVIILAIPFKHLESTVRGLSGLEEKILISPVNPMDRKDSFVYVPPKEGSAAMMLKTLVPESARICTAFNNIAGNRWRAVDEELEYSVPICGDDAEAKQVVMDIVNRISSLKAYDAGPLSGSHIVESITPLLLNIARFNHMRDVGIRFI